MQYWTLCDIYVDLYINGAAWNCALHWHYILKSLINTLNTNSIKLLKNSPFLLIPRLRLNSKCFLISTKDLFEQSLICNPDE